MNPRFESTRSPRMLDSATTRRALLGALVLMAVAAGSARFASAAVPNTAICAAAYNQMAPSAVPNGGGALVAWADVRSGDMDIYIQQTNTLGLPQWTSDGIPVCKVSGFQQFPKIIADGTGGAIVVWQDNRGADQDIYAQRVSGSGQMVWTAGGVPVCTNIGVQEFPQIVADGTGGAVIAWVDHRGADADIYVQRLDPMGNRLWNPAGVPLCAATGDQTDLTLSSDGWGGAIALWRDQRAGGLTPSDIYSQRVTATGTAQWAPDGVPVCVATDEQQTPSGVSDGAGGLLATWSDHRSGNWDIYAQRLDGTGAASWAANGVGVCAATGDQVTPKVTIDGSGGGIFAWDDRRAGNSDIYAQRVSAAGAAVWGANGVAVCTATADQVTPAIAADNAGGALISWNDGRTPGNGTDIYAQKLSGATGVSVWAANGVALCDTLLNQESPVVVHDGEGGALVVWRDFRSGTSSDVYAQRVDAGGLVVGQCPDTIPSLVLNATATAASQYDYYNVPVPVTFYWNGIGVRGGAGSDWDVEFYDELSYKEAPFPVCFSNIKAGSNGGSNVDFVVTSYETNRTPSNTTYGARVSRFAGSGSSTVEWDEKDITIAKDGAGVSASNWTGVLDVYDLKLFAGQTYTFDFTHTGSADIKALLFTSNGIVGPYSAGRANAVFEAKDRYTIYTAPVTEFYGVVLVNDNGLSGGYTLKVLTGVPVGVGGGPAAKETKLMGVAPNPAHGPASIRFSLQEAGDVSFRVLDMAGRVVGSIPSQRWQPGTWAVPWDARGSDGRSVSAGVYFVQMELNGRKLGQQRLALVR
jgi:flagellar hook capping protein FlgD